MLELLLWAIRSQAECNLFGDTDFCHSCMKLEVVPDTGCYQRCFECGHVYATEADLLRRYNEACDHLDAQPPLFFLEETKEPVKRLTKADEIAFCQECLHDF